MPSFKIPDMTCGHCKETVEKAIFDLDETAKVMVDLDAHNVDVVTQATATDIVAVLKSAGYEAEAIKT